MRPTPAGTAYRPDVDGLRALAVGAVVLYHAGLGCPGGYVGVDVFFVISGYLITALLLRDLRAGRFSLAGFYERRCRRIVPAATVVVAATLAAGVWRQLPSDLVGTGRSAAAQSAAAGNVYFFLQSTRYFGTGAQSMPLLHVWSLGVEEQFYVGFPLLLWACFAWTPTRSRAGLLAVLGGLCAVSLWVAVRQVGVNPRAAFFLLPGRAWELAAGGLVAVLPAMTAPRAVRDLVAGLGVAMMLAAVLAYGPATPFPGLAAALPCAGAAAFVWAAGGRHSADGPALPGGQAWVGRAFACRPAVFVGLISYSLYLWHWPVLVLAKEWRLAPLSVTDRVAVVGLTAGLATLSWRFVERPFRDGTRLRSRAGVFAASAAALLAVAGAGLGVAAKGGLPGRFAAKVAETDALRRVPQSLPQHEAADLDADRLVPIGDDRAAATVLLWGDSHAGVALSAFDAALRAGGVGGVAAVHSSATPVLDYSTTPTSGLGRRAGAYGRSVLAYVRRHRVRHVVLMNYWKRDLDADFDAMAVALNRTVAALRELGVSTHVVLQVPGYGVEVPKALALEMIRGHAVPGWRQTPAEHRDTQRRMYDLAGTLAAADVHVLDPMPAFVPPDVGELAVAAKGRPLYRDAHHLSPWGARRVLAPWLGRTLLPLVTPATRPATTRAGGA